MTSKTENESRVLSGLEVRAKGDGESRVVVGYAAVFNSETDIGGMFREKMMPGSFKDALARSDIHALYNHDYNTLPLGRVKSGTLRVQEDETGLLVEIDLPDTQFARDLEKSMERGDVDEMSFQFSMRGGVEEWDDSDEIPLRTIRSVGEMFDITICPRGAYPETSCALRSLEKHKATKNFNAARLRKSLKRKHLQMIGEKGGAHGAPTDFAMTKGDT